MLASLFLYYCFLRDPNHCEDSKLTSKQVTSKSRYSVLASPIPHFLLPDDNYYLNECTTIILLHLSETKHIFSLKSKLPMVSYFFFYYHNSSVIQNRISFISNHPSFMLKSNLAKSSITVTPAFVPIFISTDSTLA